MAGGVFISKIVYHMSAILSREAYEKLRQELHELKTKGR